MSGEAPVGPPAGTERAICSRAGCRAAAEAEIVWHNPRIHTDGRTKTWLACAEHRDFLHDYLASRGFPVQARPFAPRDFLARRPDTTR